jgi:hypothetical protein
VEFRAFDYGTISDVILHLRYAPRSSDVLRDKATVALKKRLSDVTARVLFRLVSIRHEFPTEWRRFSITTSGGVVPAAMTVNVDVTRFPYFVQGKVNKIESAKVFGRTIGGLPVQFAVEPGSTSPTDLSQTEFTGTSGPGNWTVATNANPADVADALLLLAYTEN